MHDWLKDQHVTMLAVAAAAAWVIGGLVIVGGIMMNKTGVPAVGLWLAGWGGVLTIGRCQDEAARREKAAFELGRRIGDDSNVSRI